MRKIALVVLVALLSVCASASADTIWPWLLPAPPAVVVPSNPDVVTMYGVVDDTMAHDVVEGIENANKKGDAAKPIMLYINSPGGYVDAGGLIVDAIVSSKRPVYTVDVELAASMGAIVHQYGAKRFILRHAVLMFHDESGSEQGYIKHIASRVEITQRKFSDFEAHVAKRTGITVAELRLRESSEWWMMGQDAVDAHACDFVSEARDFPAPSK